MTREDLLAAARRLVERPDAGTAGVWSRAVALLARQALELAVAGLWAGQPGADGLAVRSMRSQLCLTTYVDEDVATRPLICRPRSAAPATTTHTNWPPPQAS